MTFGGFMIELLLRNLDQTAVTGAALQDLDMAYLDGDA
jgi:hypothetical protein